MKVFKSATLIMCLSIVLGTSAFSQKRTAEEQMQIVRQKVQQAVQRQKDQQSTQKCPAIRQAKDLHEAESIAEACATNAAASGDPYNEYIGLKLLIDFYDSAWQRTNAGVYLEKSITVLRRSLKCCHFFFADGESEILDKWAEILKKQGKRREESAALREALWEKDDLSYIYEEDFAGRVNLLSRLRDSLEEQGLHREAERTKQEYAPNGEIAVLKGTRRKPNYRQDFDPVSAPPSKEQMLVEINKRQQEWRLNLSQKGIQTPVGYSHSLNGLDVMYKFDPPAWLKKMKAERDLSSSKGVGDGLLDIDGNVWLEANFAAAHGINLYARGDSQQAIQYLEISCENIDMRLSVDIAKPLNPETPNWKRVLPQECYFALALARINHVSKSLEKDQAVFIDIQKATSSTAGAALTARAARDFAISRGAGKALQEIDRLVTENAAFASQEPFGPQQIEAFKGAIFSQNLEEIKKIEQLAKRSRERSANFEGNIRAQIMEISRIAPEYQQLRRPEPVTQSEIQGASADGLSLLKPDEALLIWRPGLKKDYGVVYAISSSTYGWAKMGLSGEEIDRRVKILRDQMEPCSNVSKLAGDSCSKQRLEFNRQAAFELYRALFESQEIKKVVGNKQVKKLMIVASGSLTSIPPGILVSSEPDPLPALDKSPEGWATTNWLLRRYAITVLPSVASLRALRGSLSKINQHLDARSTAASGRLFMMADPNFSGKKQDGRVVACDEMQTSISRGDSYFLTDGKPNKQALSELPPLPCTNLEAQELRRSFGGLVLTGGDAREARLSEPSIKKALASAEIVAFATHGLISGDFGIGEPALALAAPLENTQGDDGLLDATDIANLRTSARLVILSACNTSTPDAHDATGLSALARAFFHAGARGVLVSHWRVKDSAAAILIAKTARLISTGVANSIALQRASIEYLDDASSDITGKDGGRGSHPSYWAPFTMMGLP